VVHEQHCARPGTALRLDRELTCEDLEGPRSVLREDRSITLALSQLPVEISSKTESQVRSVRFFLPFRPYL
jgi:hypothetical protein